MRRGLVAAVVLALAGSVAAEEATPERTEDQLEASGVAIQTVCTNCNNADLSLGGLGNDHVPIVCDGIPVPKGLAQAYLLSVAPPTILDKIAVKRGPYSAELEGSAVGGSIRLERREPQPGLQLFTSADAGSFGWGGARVDLSGGGEKLRGGIVASWATSDTIDANDDGNNELGSFDRKTWDARGEWRIGSDRTLRAGLQGYDESQKDGRAGYDYLNDLLNPADSNRYNRQDVDLRRLQADAAFETSFDGGSRLRIGALGAERSEDIYEELTKGQPLIKFYDIAEDTAAAQLAWSRPIGFQFSVRAGASWSRSDSTVLDIRSNLSDANLGGLPFDQVFTFAREERVDEAGVWTEGLWSPRDGIELEVGLRYVDVRYEDSETDVEWLVFPVPEGSRTLPRAAFTWKPVPAWTLRASAGSGYRVPGQTYSEVCCGRKYRGNRGIAMERSFAAGVEATWQPGPDVKVSGSYFRTSFDDYALKAVSLTYGYGPTYQNMSVPEARFDSLGFEGRWQATSWLSLRGSISWLNPDNASPDDAVPVIADFGSPFEYTLTTQRIPYLACRTAAATIDVKPDRATTISASFQHQGAMVIQYFDGNNLQPDELFSQTQPWLIPTPSFWTMNVRIGRTFSKGIDAYLGVDNVTDYVQTDLGNPAIDHDWGPLRGRYYYVGMGYRYGR